MSSKVRETSSEETISKVTKEIGNPIQLNTTCDPYHRVSQKMKKFMTTIDLIPVDWDLQLKVFTATEEQKNKDNIKGAMSYNFKQPILDYESRCEKYGLDKASCLRILTNSESIYSERYGNEYGENQITSKLNEAGSIARNIIPLMRSVGKDTKDIEKAIQDKLGNTELDAAIKGVASNYGGGLAETAKDVLFKGRRINLPKIYTGSNYSPSLQANVKLVSPYGDSKSIQKWVLEPLIYLLLLACPDTNDGVTYGGNTFIKMRAYGIADFNIGYISDISVRRGDSTTPCNKYGQPLSADITFSISSLIDGFACVNGKSQIKTAQVSDILPDGILQSGEMQEALDKDIQYDYGMITVDNIIKSFKPIPNTTIDVNNGNYPGNAITGVLGAVQGSIAGAVGGVMKGVRGAVGNVVGGVMTDVLM